MTPTENNKPNGTAVQLRDYIEAKLNLIRDGLDEKIHFVERSALSSAAMLEKRLEGMNEFRDALKNQSNTFTTRPEHDRVVQDIQFLKEHK